MQLGTQISSGIKWIARAFCLSLSLFASSTLTATANSEFDTAIDVCIHSYSFQSFEEKMTRQGWKMGGWLGKDISLPSVLSAFIYSTTSADTLNNSIDFLNRPRAVELSIGFLTKGDVKFFFMVPLGGPQLCLITGSNKIMTAIKDINLNKLEYFPIQRNQQEPAPETTRTLYEGRINNTFIVYAANVDKSALLEKIQTFSDSKHDFSLFLAFYNAVDEANILIAPDYLSKR